VVATAQQSTRRRERERDLVAATRRLFDERGMLDAPIEEIARAVGIARGLIYRQFSSKEELFVLTVTHYLSELESTLEVAIDGTAGPAVQLEDALRAYAGFCERYPAFLDVSLSLMHRPALELKAVLSDSVWLRLGQSMAACIDRLIRVLRAGAEDGVFAVDDPDYTASILWTQILGAMHLARCRVGVSLAAPDVPRLFPIEPQRVVETCVASALATVRA
jgi:AcrR family transcriptional regulator